MNYFNISIEIIQYIIDKYQILCIILIRKSKVIQPKEAVMFDPIVVELMKAENRSHYVESELGQYSMKPIHFNPSLLDRGLAVLGETMINIGLKLKERPNAKLNTEQVHSPNYLIML